MDEQTLAAMANGEAEIATYLRNAVLDRRLAPGVKLPEEELATAFSTTRARIRRVLLTLSQEKIVTLFPGRGAFVAAPSHAEASDVIAARILLEVGLLAQRPDPFGDVPLALHDIVVAEQDAVARADRAAMIRLSGAFHLSIAHWLGNAVLADILDQLIRRTSLIIALYEPINGICCLPTDHSELLQALQAQQSQEAANLMNAHLRRMEASLDFAHRPRGRMHIPDLLLTPGPRS